MRILITVITLFLMSCQNQVESEKNLRENEISDDHYFEMNSSKSKKFDFIESDKDPNEDEILSDYQIEMHEYQKKKSVFRLDQRKNKYKLRLVADCISDTFEFYDRNKLDPYYSKISINNSETSINFIFIDDCCSEHVTSLSKTQDTVFVSVEQNSIKVCECICPYEYQLVFQELDSLVKTILINEHKINIKVN